MMKKMMILAMMMVMTVAANAMSYTSAKNEALFLSDKMAYELNLSEEQYMRVYELNLNYLLSLDRAGDVYGRSWDCRNTGIRCVLTTFQYNRYVRLGYFYRPVAWRAGTWTFGVYARYDRGYYCYHRPVPPPVHHGPAPAPHHGHGPHHGYGPHHGKPGPAPHHNWHHR